MSETDPQLEEGKAQQREEWARKGVIGKCNDCGKLIARTEAKQQKMPLGPGWNQVNYYCPDCFMRESEWGVSTSGCLIGVDGELVSENVPTGRDFV
jgi:hypothetical protein